MVHLLNLLAAIALLVWGTHIVRTGVLRVFGESLRGILAKSFSNRASAMAAGLGVTTIVQSSTATCLIVASFVGKGLVTTAAALAVILGADHAADEADPGVTEGEAFGVQVVEMQQQRDVARRRGG